MPRPSYVTRLLPPSSLQRRSRSRCDSGKQRRQAAAAGVRYAATPLEATDARAAGATGQGVAAQGAGEALSYSSGGRRLLQQRRRQV